MDDPGLIPAWLRAHPRSPPHPPTHTSSLPSRAAAPEGIGEGGAVLEGGEGGEAAPHEDHYWGQALQYLDRAVPVAPGRKSERSPPACLFLPAAHRLLSRFSCCR
jgi:hypothetical protein